jgi:integrase
MTFLDDEQYPSLKSPTHARRHRSEEAIKRFRDKCAELQKQKAEGQLMSNEEVEALLCAFRSSPKASHYLGLVKTLFATGFKVNDCIKLRWSDIDLEQGKVTLPCKQSWTSTDPDFMKTLESKGIYPTDSGWRIEVQISSEFREILESMIKSGPLPENLVFTDLNGAQIKHSSFRHIWGHMCCKAGLKARFNLSAPRLTRFSELLNKSPR